MSLNLNYKPEAVVEISGLSREEWLDYRKKGIGGSDAAAIMGVSPFATKRDLFYDKTGIRPAFQENEDNWVAKEVGHRLEDLVAEIFSQKTGLKIFRCARCSDTRCIPLCLQTWTFSSNLQMVRMESWSVRQPTTTVRKNGQTIQSRSTMSTRYVTICPS